MPSEARADPEREAGEGPTLTARSSGAAEAWIHVEIDRETDEDDLEAIDAGLRSGPERCA